ncbi:hypothetical protein ElyMa_001091600 [Elysia marginata]|uniref:Uncharacterized protein n=1 Tax=Elysia marginata TaxID=1093978 RepID=A0AAV4HSR2_9GAST|nr:hypothetical protein ElyMa_001091600 [Elysia marginata]
MNSAMQQVTGNDNATICQHAESSQSRLKRDDKDMRSLLNYLLSRNPFACDETLRSISTGAMADQPVNSDKAKEVGHTILESMRNAAVKDYTFKKKDQVVTMAVKVSAKVDSETLQVDLQLLFQRLVTVANGLSDDLDLPSVFKYELSCTPAALFDPSGLLREADKAKLVDALVVLSAFKESEQNVAGETIDSEYVLDGGSLLHIIPWRRSDTYASIGQTYLEYAKKMYGKPRIVFDGYNNGPSTKDATHLRRSCGVVGPTIKFNPEMVCNARKEHLLGNPKNKQAFVQYLGVVIKKNGCQVLHACRYPHCQYCSYMCSQCNYSCHRRRR